VVEEKKEFIEPELIKHEEPLDTVTAGVTSIYHDAEV